MENKDNLSVSTEQYKGTDIYKGIYSEDIEKNLSKGFSEVPEEEVAKELTEEERYNSEMKTKQLQMKTVEEMDKKYSYKSMKDGEKRALRILINIDGKSSKEKLQSVIDHFGVSKLAAINILADATADMKVDKEDKSGMESMEHTGTYNKLKKDAKDGKLDTSKEEMGDMIDEDHKKLKKSVDSDIKKGKYKDRTGPPGSYKYTYTADGEGLPEHQIKADKIEELKEAVSVIDKKAKDHEVSINQHKIELTNLPGSQGDFKRKIIKRLESQSSVMNKDREKILNEIKKRNSLEKSEDDIFKAFGLDNDYLEKGRGLPIGTINKYGEIKTADGWKHIKKKDRTDNHKTAIKHAGESGEHVKPDHDLHPDKTEGNKGYSKPKGEKKLLSGIPKSRRINILLANGKVADTYQNLAVPKTMSISKVREKSKEIAKQLGLSEMEISINDGGNLGVYVAWNSDSTSDKDKKTVGKIQDMMAKEKVSSKPVGEKKWNSLSEEDRVSVLKSRAPSFGDKYAMLDWEDLSPEIQDMVGKEKKPAKGQSLKISNGQSEFGSKIDFIEEGRIYFESGDDQYSADLKDAKWTGTKWEISDYE